MPWLHVTVRMHDAVFEERLCPVTHEVWLGDAPDAAVAFPGGKVRVRRHGDRLRARGRWLDPGRPLRLREGAVDLSLEAVTVRASRGSAHDLPDVRLLVATLAAVLVGAWLDTGLRFVEDNPIAAERVRAMLQPVLLGGDGLGELADSGAPELLERLDTGPADSGPADTGGRPDDWPPPVTLQP